MAELRKTQSAALGQAPIYTNHQLPPWQRLRFLEFLPHFLTAQNFALEPHRSAGGASAVSCAVELRKAQSAALGQAPMYRQTTVDTMRLSGCAISYNPAKLCCIEPRRSADGASAVSCGVELRKAQSATLGQASHICPVGRKGKVIYTKGAVLYMRQLPT